MTNNIFINAQELADELGVSKAMAYKMIKGWNERLEQMGYSNALQCARLVTTLYSFGRTISIGNASFQCNASVLLKPDELASTTQARNPCKQDSGPFSMMLLR